MGSIMDEMKRIEHPENWLSHAGLMDIMETEYYHAQLSAFFEGQLKWGEVERYITWSDAFDNVLKWIKKIVFETVYGDNGGMDKWRKLIVDALSPLEYDYYLKECGKFWIANYSLSSSIRHKRINIRYMRHCSLYIENKKTQLAQNSDTPAQINKHEIFNATDDKLDAELSQTITNTIYDKGVTSVIQALNDKLSREQKSEIIQELTKGCSR